jgi:predicted transcriptional regulator
MGTYRRQIEIVEDILDAAEELTIDQNGASITNLIQKANVSHTRISKILSNLVSQGLLEQVDSKRACKYKISMTGKEFLREFKRFSEFTDNFGLTI